MVISGVERRRRELVPPAQLHQLRVDAVAQHVRLLLHHHRPLRQIGILLQESLHGLSQHADGQLAELDENGVRRLGFQPADGEHLAGDAFRIIPDPLQLLVDLDGGEDEPQMAGDRLVAHQEFQAQPVQFGLPFVNMLIAQDDAVSQLPAPLHQRLQARFQRPPAKPGHLGDLGPNRVDIPLQRFFKMRRRIHARASQLINCCSGPFITVFTP